jgi:hypothetical protein
MHEVVETGENSSSEQIGSVFFCGIDKLACCKRPPSRVCQKSGVKGRNYRGKLTIEAGLRLPNQAILLMSILGDFPTHS